jgi:hypothetical protein
MFRKSLIVIASVISTAAAFGQFASQVVSYSPGTGYSKGFTNAAAALGEPSRVTPGQYGGPVDPFDPPYEPSQLVSIGAGGWLTLQFDRPIINHPNNPFGIDFIIYGNSGFIITNAFDPNTFDWIGTPATDGSLLGNNDGQTRVSVSADGERFYTLDPALAPTVDGPLPTDGSGSFQRPAYPGLKQSDFAGLTLEEIRVVYGGSAGGAGYDISWARDKQGRAVRLGAIRFVRIEVLSGKSEVDGISAVFSQGREEKLELQTSALD